MNTYYETLESYDEIVLKDKIRAEKVFKQNIDFTDKKYGWKGSKEFNKELNVEDVLELLENSKKFKLSEDLVEIFLNTDSDVDYVHTPFESIFIDALIPITNKVKIYGMAVFDSKIDHTLGVFCLAKEEKEDGTKLRHFTSFGLNYWKREIIPEHLTIPCDIDKPLVKRKMALFILSFLKFLYNPEVEILKKEYSPIRIKRRIEKGKPVNNHFYLKISGKTRKYIEDFNNQISKTYEKHTDSWIVRGFYRKLISKRYKEKRGTEIWVAPFVKGFGEIKGKEYVVTTKKKVFKNQLFMENIVKLIFRNHLVLSNTRGFLDGLEIDCYIPDLKIGFEYDGEQHYVFPNAYHKSKKEFESQVKRDREKRKLAMERGIKLITIRHDEELSEDLIKSKLKDKQNTPTPKGETN